MFRRVIASALALALCASASVPAFADSEAADDSTLGTQATADGYRFDPSDFLY